MNKYSISIGRENAIRLAETRWWESLPAKEIAYAGLLIQELCLPFDVLHQAVEKALGRPVFTHEFGLNYEGLIEELMGTRPAPTMQAIIEMIPADKRVVLVIR